MSLFATDEHCAYYGKERKYNCPPGFLCTNSTLFAQLHLKFKNRRIRRSSGFSISINALHILWKDSTQPTCRRGLGAPHGIGRAIPSAIIISDLIKLYCPKTTRIFLHFDNCQPIFSNQFSHISGTPMPSSGPLPPHSLYRTTVHTSATQTSQFLHQIHTSPHPLSPALDSSAQTLPTPDSSVQTLTSNLDHSVLRLSPDPVDYPVNHLRLQRPRPALHRHEQIHPQHEPAALVQEHLLRIFRHIPRVVHHAQVFDNNLPPPPRVKNHEVRIRPPVPRQDNIRFIPVRQPRAEQFVRPDDLRLGPHQLPSVRFQAIHLFPLILQLPVLRCFPLFSTKLIRLHHRRDQHFPLLSQPIINPTH